MSFINPQKRKSREVKTEERGGQGMGLPLLIKLSGNSLSR
jgi:hypothetical protein